jgi:hypothetical protein
LRLIGEIIDAENLSSFYIGMTYATSLTEEVNESWTNSFIRNLYKALQLTKFGLDIQLSDVTYNYRLDSVENRKIYEKTKASYDSYKSDETLFNAELERLRTHYESIKHLYLGGKTHDNFI